MHQYSNKGNLSRSCNMTYMVATATKPVTAKVLVIGDSTVAGGQIVDQVIVKDTADATMAITWIGTVDAGNGLHEGRSGMTIDWFYANASSPFYNVAGFAAGYAAYCVTNGTPDVVIVRLGINDFYNKASDALMNTALTTAVTQLQGMIAGFKAANPVTLIGLDLVSGPSSQDHVGVDYSLLPAWRVKRNFQIYNKKLVDTDFGENVKVLPSNLGMKSPDDFTNGVHPDAGGYVNIGNAYYAFLKNYPKDIVNCAYLGWHNSKYNNTVLPATQTYGAIDGNIITQVFTDSEFNGIGVRFAANGNRIYTLNYRCLQIDATNSSVGLLLWNGTAAVTYDIPVDKCGQLTTFLGNLNYIGKTQTNDVWYEYSFDVDLTDAGTFDSISLHVNSYKAAATTGLWAKVDLDGCSITYA